MAPKLGYWRLRGLGQPIKLMLAYLGIEYEDVLYEHEWEAWMAEKYTLGLTFPNLPYYIDEEKGLKMTQTLAIMRHLARGGGLVAGTEEELIRQDMAEQQIWDFRKSIVQLVYEDWVDDEKKKQYLDGKFPKYIEEFSNFLEDHDWVAGKKVRNSVTLSQHFEELGISLICVEILKRNWAWEMILRLWSSRPFPFQEDLGKGCFYVHFPVSNSSGMMQLTYVDFVVYEIMEWALYVEPTCLDKYENLKKYMKRFEDLPQIKAYRASDTFMEWPLFYKFAHFGYKPEDMKKRFPEGKRPE